MRVFFALKCSPVLDLEIMLEVNLSFQFRLTTILTCGIFSRANSLGSSMLKYNGSNPSLCWAWSTNQFKIILHHFYKLAIQQTRCLQYNTQGSFSGMISRYSHIFFYTKSHKNYLNEKKKLRWGIFSIPTVFLCFTHTDHSACFIYLIFRYLGAKRLASEVWGNQPLCKTESRHHRSNFNNRQSYF